MTFRSIGLVGAGLVAAAGTASALDIGVTSKKLVVVDKGAQVKVVYVSKDVSGAISKGAGTSLDSIEVVVTIAYDNGSAAGSFVLPAGESDGTSGWVVNKATTAKYVNKDAPGGPTQAKVGVIKPGKLLKLVGKGLGDVPLDVGSAAFPPAVRTSYCVLNAGEEICHCSLFTECNGAIIAQGSGRKLVCRNGGPAACDPVCVPDCAGKECGPDGCGGSCGTCAPADGCVDGQCEECVPDCLGRQCGPDGCGGICGSCAGDEICTDDGQCF